MSTTSQSTSGPHFTDVDGKPGCEHGIPMDESCDACENEIADYEAKLEADQRAHDAMLDSQEQRIGEPRLDFVNCRGE